MAVGRYLWQVGAAGQDTTVPLRCERSGARNGRPTGLLQLASRPASSICARVVNSRRSVTVREPSEQEVMQLNCGEC